MPISGTSTDYSTRQKDIHIFQGVDVDKSSAITPSFGRISNYCAGVQKLVQRYAIMLLTELGSQAGTPEFGSNLIAGLNTRNLRINRADLFHIFNFANMRVIAAFREYQARNAGLPEDEQLATTVLRDIVVNGDSVNLVIQVYPLQTTPVEFLLPIPTNK